MKNYLIAFNEESFNLFAFESHNEIQDDEAHGFINNYFDRPSIISWMTTQDKPESITASFDSHIL